MGMGHGGLVAYVEAQIERDIALGRIHPNGRFGSEAKLARHYDVCRGTIREALRRLAARGVVVQRPGRKTRAVPLDESLTLENLGLALHDMRSPDARWLLEGYFSLRRQVLVELLSDCCARASKRDLDHLGSICFGLWDAARWESGAYCAQVEFELLRLAARVADRPGHVLLVQSLQRAFMVGAAQLLPLLGGEPLRQWVNCAKDALHDRDTRAIQQELSALMKAHDDLVLNAFAHLKPVAPEDSFAREGLLSARESAIGQDEVQEARPGVEGHGVRASESANRQGEEQETHREVEGASISTSASAHRQNEVLAPHLGLDEASSGAEGHGVSAFVPVNRQAEVLATRFGLDGQGVGPPPSGCPFDEASAAYRPVAGHGNRAPSLETEVGATGAVSEDAKAPEAQASPRGPGGGPSVDGLPGASGLRA
ncbi:FadR/GntR family transcriptional regulator [Corallococcus sp. AB049A]|uniref:FadR/GntR family transcriptional regulator n=1 Tax=Corallococcus sp. AB049A TaxID=2316721 RepID=UPI001F2FE083|nr:GntR family transcriptional regulator [Corallococcus sp. AB049A]